MKDVLNSIKAGLLQRIENPLIGSFSILFVIFNWRAFAIFVFSAKPVEERLSYIEQTYAHWYYYFGLPALFAILLTFLHPLVTYWITRYLMWVEQKKRILRSLVKSDELADLISIKKKETEINLLDSEIEAQRLRHSATKTLIEGLGNALNKGEPNSMNGAISALHEISKKKAT